MPRFLPLAPVWLIAPTLALYGTGGFVYAFFTEYGVFGLGGAASVAFGGDVIYDGGLLDSLPGSDPEEYARSLRRLRDLPVRVTHAGHGPSFGGDRLHRLIDNYLQA